MKEKWMVWTQITCYYKIKYEYVGFAFLMFRFNQILEYLILMLVIFGYYILSHWLLSWIVDLGVGLE